VPRHDGGIAALDPRANIGSDPLAVHLRLRPLSDVTLAGCLPSGRPYSPPAVLPLPPGGPQGQQSAQCSLEPGVTQHC